MSADSLREELAKGIFLSSMMGVTDGAYVAAHGRGGQMVQIGALIADLHDRSHEARYLLPEEQGDMVEVLGREVEAANEGVPGVPVCLNAAPGDLESALRMARAFHEAGGAIFELNCHGGYGKLLSRGLLGAMVRPEHRKTMVEWLRALCSTAIPVVAKFNGTDTDTDFVGVLEEISDVRGLCGVHFNVRDDSSRSPNLALVKSVRPHIPGMLWCSGYVSNARQASELFEAGADCVGVAQAALDERGAVARVASGRGR